MKFKFDWFLKGMLVAVALAFLWPAPGAKGGFLQPELLNKIGIALVFFLNGLGLGILAVSGGWMSAPLQTGFFYLCALPSTVSSSVALTIAAGGNIAAAVFNATLSSLIGVVLTPLWLALVLKQGGGGFDVLPVIIDLVIWVVFPLVLGQCSRPLLSRWASRHKARIQIVDRLTILMLVYTSFADTVQRGVWSKYGPLVLIETVVGSALLFAIVLGLTMWLAKVARLPLIDQIAAVFCGSKKTLASGVPMAHLIFGSNPAIGVILLPIMIYHPLQLAVGGALAQYWKARTA